MATCPKPRPRSAPIRRRTTRRSAHADQYYFPNIIDNSRLVKTPDPRERYEQKLLIFVFLLLGAALLAGAYQRFANVQAGYRLEALKAQREQLSESNRQLRLEEASLRDPERVDAIARRQLGMGIPIPGQVVHLENHVDEAGGAVLARAVPLKAGVPAVP